MGHVHQFTSYIKVPDGNYSAIHGVLWGPFCAGDRLACQLSVPVAWMPCFGTLRLAQLDQIILQNHLWSHSFLGISLIFLDLVHWFHEFEEKSTGHPFFFSDFYTQVSTDFVRHKKTWLRRREKIRWKPGWQWLIIIFPHIFFMKKMLVFGCFWLISCYILFLGSISPGEVAAALESHQLAGKVPCCHGDGLMWHDFCYVAIEHGHRNSLFT